MKKILVPIDYSENSQNVLAHALGIAQVAGAEIMLLHAFFPIVSPPASFDATNVTLALEEAKQHELEAFAADALKDALTPEATATLNATAKELAIDNVKITCVAKMGGSYDQILQAIEAYKADLVVMGMQEGEAISQALIGSTTISVMQESTVPVLAIPKGVAYKGVNTVVFAAALHKLPANADLHQLSDFVELFQAKLQVLHLYRNNKHFENFDAHEAMAVLQRNFRNINYDSSFDLREDVAAGIQDFVEEMNAELLVLVPQKHNLLERLLDKSVTGQITAHPQVPLLALPASVLHKTQNLTTEAEIA